MLKQLDHNTYFYDASGDLNYDKIEIYLKVGIQKKSKFYISLKDKNILRKYKINSFLNKESVLKENINLIVYRNIENYYYCKNLTNIDLIDSKEMILNFDQILSSTYTQSLDFFTNYVINHKIFFMSYFKCDNIIELVKRFR